MAERELEFRGINREHLGMYFEELGAKQVTETFPYIYVAEDWTGSILAEEVITFTSIFIVNSVQVRFRAAGEDALNELIKQYRFKTTRIGG